MTATEKLIYYLHHPLRRTWYTQYIQTPTRHSIIFIIKKRKEKSFIYLLYYQYKFQRTTFIRLSLVLTPKSGSNFYRSRQELCVHCPNVETEPTLTPRPAGVVGGRRARCQSWSSPARRSQAQLCTTWLCVSAQQQNGQDFTFLSFSTVASLCNPLRYFPFRDAWRSAGQCSPLMCLNRILRWRQKTWQYWVTLE